MTEYNLEDLPYPMFELTEGEISKLSAITEEDLNYSWGFLCNALENRFGYNLTLLQKINHNLSNNTLGGYFAIKDYKGVTLSGLGTKLSVNMRLIWIRKLIEFNQGK